jgi:hypothetical protein
MFRNVKQETSVRIRYEKDTLTGAQSSTWKALIFCPNFLFPNVVLVMDCGHEGKIFLAIYGLNFLSMDSIPFKKHPVFTTFRSKGWSRTKK